MDMGMIVGIHLYSTEFITLVSQSSDWAGTTAGGAVGAATAAGLNAAYGGVGTALGARKSTTSINFLDLGYLYDMKDIVGGMSISGGIGLPVLGSSVTIDLVFGSTGYALIGGLYTESLTADDGSAMSYFVDYGYTFGSYEALLGLRTISTESKATVDETKGLGKILGESIFTSSGESTSYSLGFGRVF